MLCYNQIIHANISIDLINTPFALSGCLWVPLSLTFPIVWQGCSLLKFPKIFLCFWVAVFYYETCELLNNFNIFIFHVLFCFVLPWYRYTYGQPVKGNASIGLKLQNDYLCRKLVKTSQRQNQIKKMDFMQDFGGRGGRGFNPGFNRQHVQCPKKQIVAEVFLNNHGTLLC